MIQTKIMNKKTQQTTGQPWVPPEPMTDREFKALGEFIQSRFGIKMPPAKKTMLQSRLTKRLRAMNMSSYSQYQDYLFSPEGMKEEVPRMLDAVSTNKTDFFRERSHFDILSQELLPVWLKNTGGGKILTAWSAGCATGEEPYSLAMILAEFAAAHPPLDFTILGTDISEEAIGKARKAIYFREKINDIPPDFKKKYLMRSRDPRKARVRIVPELRNKVSFRRLNLMESLPSQNNKKDIIFCRNVIIYFERAVQEELFKKCCDCLKPNGYLFIGHSETLGGMHLPLRQIQPTVYQKK